MHEDPEQRGGRERFVDRVGERVAPGGRPVRDPGGRAAGGNPRVRFRLRWVHGGVVAVVLFWRRRGDIFHSGTCGTEFN